jgi:phosphate transport system substrate-binding protein
VVRYLRRPSSRASASGLDRQQHGDLAAALARPAGETSYPIVAATFVAVPDGKPPGRATLSALTVFDWCLDHGSAAASDLGSMPVPSSALVR